MAAASTLVAELSSHFLSASESGSGRTCIFVKFMISKCPAAILDSGWGGGGLDRGDIIWPGRLAGWLELLSWSVAMCTVVV